MRVVCDNCGAVYKIADSKLSKDVNKATCKRCGHKIVIYKGGGQPSDEDEDDSSESEERTVIKSVDGLDKLGRSTGSAPAIGSLTAELRAISLPGIQPVAPPKPATLGPVGASMPISPLPGPIGNPPKDSPATAVYGGARAAVSSLPPLVVPGLPPAKPTREEGDKTRPMSQPPGPAVGPLPSAATPPAPPLMMVLPAAPVAPPPQAQRPSAVPPVPPAGPVTQPPRSPAPSQQKVALGKGGPAPQAPPAAEAAPRPPAPSPAPAPAGNGAAELGMVAVLGALALLGTVITAVAPAPASTAGLAVAAIGAASCLFLPLLSQRGRRPGQMGVAIFLGLLIGSAVGYLAHNRAPVDDSAEAGLGGTALDALPEPATPEPTPVEPPTEAALEPPSPAAAELTAAEQEEARRFAGDGSTGIGVGTPTPNPRSPEPSTPAVKREPTPTATPTPTPATSDLTRPKKPVGPGAPPDEADESSTATAAGPSPFVIDTIIRNNANVNRCFQLEKARGTDIAGKIYLKFSIAPEGLVSRARITTSRFAGTALDQCVSKEINDLKFPPFEGETQQVRYPFNVL